MKKINLTGGFNGLQAGIGYEWDNKQIPAGPVIDIYGTGNGWAKETHGPVVIKGNSERTVVRIIGPGGWKILGNETISA